MVRRAVYLTMQLAVFALGASFVPSCVRDPLVKPQSGSASSTNSLKRPDLRRIYAGQIFSWSTALTGTTAADTVRLKAYTDEACKREHATGQLDVDRGRIKIGGGQVAFEDLRFRLSDTEETIYLGAAYGDVISCSHGFEVVQTFGDLGYVVYERGGPGATGRPFEEKDDLVQDMTSNSKDQLVAVGYSRNAAGGLEPVLWKYAPNGQLIRVVAFGNGSRGAGGAQGAARRDIMESIAVDAQDRIVVAGRSASADGAMLLTLIRFSDDGHLDRSFGVPHGHRRAGFVTLDREKGAAGATGANRFDRPVDLVIDAQGRYLLGGHSRNPSGGQEATIWRFTADGDLDTTFNAPHGFVVFRINGPGFSGRQGQNRSDWVEYLTTTSGGEILVTGPSTFGDGRSEIFVAQYRADGTLDPSFGTGGYVIQTQDGGALAGAPREEQADRPIGIRYLREERKILLGIHSKNQAGGKVVGLLRLNRNGSLDVTFGDGGVAVHNQDPPTGIDSDKQWDWAQLAGADNQGRYVLVGVTNWPSDGPYSGAHHPVIWRYQDSGDPASPFRMALEPHNRPDLSHAAPWGVGIVAATFDSKERVVAGGWSLSPANPSSTVHKWEPAFWRVTPQGAPDGVARLQDADGDGVDNELEEDMGTDPHDPDSDRDGLDDGTERQMGTNPLHGDTDGDTMADGWEVTHDFDPLKDDALEDADGDRFPNVFEFARATDPRSVTSVPLPDRIVDLKHGADSNTDTIEQNITDAIRALQIKPSGLGIIGLRKGIYTGSKNVSWNISYGRFLILGLEGAAHTVLDGSRVSTGPYTTRDTVLSGVTIRHFRTPSGAIHVRGDTLLLDSVLIQRNRATSQYGAALTADFGTLVVRNSTIMGNRGSGRSEAIYAQDAKVRIDNSIFWNPGDAGEIFLTNGSTVSAAFSIIRQDPVQGLNNVLGVLSPKLRSDGRLREGSPARGRGRFNGASFDMDHEPRSPSTPDIGVDQWVDGDADKIPDTWERHYAPSTEVFFETADFDKDGVTDPDEYDLELDPTNPDTDQDLLSDGAELVQGTDPGVHDAADLDGDANHDGVDDSVGLQLGIDPRTMDSDGDGLSNREESSRGLDPLSADTDGDGVPDLLDAFPLDPRLTDFVPAPVDTTAPVIILMTPPATVID